MHCRICLEEDGVLVQPCRCKGFDHGYFHQHCLETWVNVSKRTMCEICHAPFVHEERCGFEPEKYCLNFMSMPYDLNARHIVSKQFIAALGISTILTVSVDIHNLTDYVVYSSMALLLLAFTVQMYYHQSRFFMLDLALLWKTATTITMILFGSMMVIDINEQCFNDCVDRLKPSMCNADCPVYYYYDGMEKYISTAISVDVLCFGCLFVSRAFIRCFTHMRKNKYSDHVGSNQTV